MIDHEAAAEMWDRHLRGERGVFGSRLYTEPGRKRYDEFRRRFHRDPEFRETVDSYTGKFEELLREVAPGESNRALARQILASDEGKVYTILAHASGKLD